MPFRHHTHIFDWQGLKTEYSINNREPVVVYWLGNNLYLNITNKCSNKCWFCFRNYRRGVGDFNLKLSEEPALFQVISELREAFPLRHWSEVVFCGFGEPTARLDLLLEVAMWIKKNHPMVPIRLDTNGHGYALNQGIDVVEELKAAGVTKASVSLNGFNEETYNENCRPTIIHAFESTLDFIRKAKSAGLEVDVSALRMPEVETQKIREITDWLGVPFRIRDYIPCFW